MATKAKQKTDAPAANPEDERIAALLAIGDKLTRRVEQAVDELDAVDGLVDRRGIQQLSSALKSLRDLAQGGRQGEAALLKLDQLIEGIDDAAKR